MNSNNIDLVRIVNVQIIEEIVKMIESQGIIVWKYRVCPSCNKTAIQLKQHPLSICPECRHSVRWCKEENVSIDNWPEEGITHRLRSGTTSSVDTGIPIRKSHYVKAIELSTMDNSVKWMKLELIKQGVEEID